MTDVQVKFYIFQISKPLSLVMGGTRAHTLLIFGRTPKPSCLGAQQEDSCNQLPTQGFGPEGTMGRGC